MTTVIDSNANKALLCDTDGSEARGRDANYNYVSNDNEVQGIGGPILL